MAIVNVRMDIPEEFAVDPEALAAAVFARLADEAGYVDLPDEDGRPVAPTAITVEVTATAGVAEIVHPEPRSYWIGLPVGITVHADGRVTYEVDLSEASDIAEGQPTDSDLRPLYAEADVDADTETVSAAVTAGTLRLAK